MSIWPCACLADPDGQRGKRNRSQIEASPNPGAGFEQEAQIMRFKALQAVLTCQYSCKLGEAVGPCADWGRCQVGLDHLAMQPPCTQATADPS